MEYSSRNRRRRFIVVLEKNTMGRFGVEKEGIRGENRLDRKFQILLVVGALLLLAGTILNFAQNPLLWGTGGVALLFIILLFRIDPLSPPDK